jgi:hypothetical protein
MQVPKKVDLVHSIKMAIRGIIFPFFAGIPHAVFQVLRDVAVV